MPHLNLGEPAGLVTNDVERQNGTYTALHGSIGIANVALSAGGPAKQHTAHKQFHEELTKSKRG
jgi:hypothetical protein